MVELMFQQQKEAMNCMNILSNTLYDITCQFTSITDKNVTHTFVTGVRQNVKLITQTN